jgi:MOSC domain-containing protein YiiM
MKTQQKLFARYLKHLMPGRLDWIGLRPAHKQEMLEVDTALALQNHGLEGDHRCNKIPGSGRQITIISAEYIQQIEHFSGKQNIAPGLLRRNLIVSGINLSALRYQQFTVGEAVLQASALCDPCSRMEQALGPGGFAAMLGHGGLCAKIIRGGQITIGDAVSICTPQGELF